MHSQENSEQKNYDLTRLFAYIGTEPTVVKEMVNTFILAATDSLLNMEKHLKDSDFKSLAKEAHKIKTSLQIFGFDDQLETIKVFEQATEALPADSIDRFNLLKIRLTNGIEALREDYGLR